MILCNYKRGGEKAEYRLFLWALNMLDTEDTNSEDYPLVCIPNNPDRHDAYVNTEPFQDFGNHMVKDSDIDVPINCFFGGGVDIKSIYTHNKDKNFEWIIAEIPSLHSKTSEPKDLVILRSINLPRCTVDSGSNELCDADTTLWGVKGIRGTQPYFRQDYFIFCYNGRQVMFMAFC